MFNLIPEENKKKLEKEYRLRLFVIIAAFLGVIASLGLFLLVPSYVISNSRLMETQKKHDMLTASLSKNNTKSSTEILKSISMDDDVLKGTLTSPAIASLVETVATSKGEGISIGHIVFSSNSSPSTLTLEGVAQTRDDLVAFSSLFQSNSLFEKADLPISDFAKDKDIDFSLTLNLKP